MFLYIHVCFYTCCVRISETRKHARRCSWWVDCTDSGAWRGLEECQYSSSSSTVSDRDTVCADRHWYTSVSDISTSIVSSLVIHFSLLFESQSAVLNLKISSIFDLIAFMNHLHLRRWENGPRLASYVWVSFLCLFWKTAVRHKKHGFLWARVLSASWPAVSKH